MLKKNGGVSSRLGIKFNESIEQIKDQRLLNGKSKQRVSTEKITNLIIRHKSWLSISEDIVKAEQKEVDQYCL